MTMYVWHVREDELYDQQHDQKVEPGQRAAYAQLRGHEQDGVELPPAAGPGPLRHELLDVEEETSTTDWYALLGQGGAVWGR